MKKQWFYVLLVVARGPVHGAEVRRRVHEETNGEVRLYPVTLYRTLDELAAAGLIVDTPHPEAPDHNEKRRYYRITGRGREALATEADALRAAARKAMAVLGAEGAR